MSLANLQVVEFSAERLAADYESNKGNGEKVRAMIRGNYTPEKLAAFVGAVCELRKAEKTVEVRELGSVIKASVPRDEQKQPLCAALTVSFKAVKEFGQKHKRLTYSIVEAAPPKKTDSALKTLNSLYAIVDNNAEDVVILSGVQTIAQELKENGNFTESQAQTLEVILQHCAAMLA